VNLNVVPGVGPEPSLSLGLWQPGSVSTTKSYKVLTLYNTNMRNTKVYSITMPPELAKQAERLAKKESRTMSELMREAFRRYQQQETTKPANLAEVLALLRSEARVKGLDQLTKQDISEAVAEARQEAVSGRRITNRARK
jgi:predicted transcriptional regulator